MVLNDHKHLTKLYLILSNLYQEYSMPNIFLPSQILLNNIPLEKARVTGCVGLSLLMKLLILIIQALSAHSFIFIITQITLKLLPSYSRKMRSSQHNSIICLTKPEV